LVLGLIFGMIYDVLVDAFLSLQVFLVLSDYIFLPQFIRLGLIMFEFRCLFLSETFELQSIHQLLSHHMKTFLTRFWKILNQKTTRKFFFLCSYFSKALGEASMICFCSSLKNTCFMELLHNRLLIDKNSYTVEAFKYNCR